MRGASRFGVRSALAGALMAFALMAPSASAVEIVDEIPVNPSAFGAYTVAPDGTVWAIGFSSGIVYNLDPENGGILESFQTYSGAWTTIDVLGDRVYAGDSPNLLSYKTGTNDTTAPDAVQSDSITGQRIGQNQMILRAGSSGNGAIALGQNNKVGIVNLTSFDTLNGNAHPYYDQLWYGAGINDPNQQSTAFESCALNGGPISGGEPPPPCGTQFGKSGSTPGQFGYAIDTAFGNGGTYVLESLDNEVSLISSGPQCGPCPSFSFGGGPGTAAGQLDSPFSIRVNPDDGHVLISSQGNRRIDEFTAGGNYVRSFGFGVLTGTDQFEVCGVDIGQCRAGTAYQTNPRSYFSRLDLVDGLLYAATPVDQSIQVISLDAGPGTNTVLLKGKPRQVKKGKKATLTARLSSCEDGYTALFQVKNGNDFDNIKAVPVNGDCKASKKVKVDKKTAYRAVSIDDNQNTLATSAKVTIKVKK